MAIIRPLTPLRYRPATAGPLESLVAPPYDVIDADERTALMEASPYNAVRLELPDPPYERVRELIAEWTGGGVLGADPTPGMIAWTQTFALETGELAERRVILVTVRAEPYETGAVRPHERTHAGPKEDRLNLLNAAGHQISPVYGLYPDRAGVVWECLGVEGAPDADFTTADGTRNRVWWIDDPVALEGVASGIADRWILIADGHHRYETAVEYAGRRRAADTGDDDGDGPHGFVMMGLTAIEDPGLVVLPTHRVLAEDPGTLTEGFDVRPVADLDELRFVLATTPQYAPSFGLVTPQGAAVITGEQQTDASPAAQLDVSVLEERILRRAFGEDQATLAHRGVLSYVKDTAEAWELGRSGRAAAVLIMRPMPKESVVAVAEAGETMPQKSTYFFPKLLTGVAFHPLD